MLKLKVVSLRAELSWAELWRSEARKGDSRANTYFSSFFLPSSLAHFLKKNCTFHLPPLVPMTSGRSRDATAQPPWVVFFFSWPPRLSLLFKLPAENAHDIPQEERRRLCRLWFSAPIAIVPHTKSLSWKPCLTSPSSLLLSSLPRM